jgi:hypothetical protein
VREVGRGRRSQQLRAGCQLAAAKAGPLRSEQGREAKDCRRHLERATATQMRTGGSACAEDLFLGTRTRIIKIFVPERSVGLEMLQQLLRAPHAAATSIDGSCDLILSHLGAFQVAIKLREFALNGLRIE